MATERPTFDLFSSEEKRLKEDELYDMALDVYRFWHAKLGRHRDIIDFDLREGPDLGERLVSRWSINPPTHDERLQNVVDVGRLLEIFRKNSPPLDKQSHNWEFTDAQIEAFYWYVKKQAGFPMDTFEFIEMTQTFKLESFSESLLEVLSERLIRDAGEVTGSSDPTSLEEWRNIHSLSRDEAKNLLREKAALAARRVKDFIDLDFHADFEVEDVDENQYWWVWANTNPKTGRFLLRQNFSQERNKIWTFGKAEELGWHEGGFHVARMARRKKLIREGRLHPFFSFTTVHGPEAAVDEGGAQTLVHLIPGAYESLSPEGKLRVDESILRSMVYGNIHLRIHDQREDLSLSDIETYIKRYIPWEPAKVIEEEVKDRKDDPLLMTYRYAYAVGVRMMLVYAENLNDRGKREFLRNIFERPYTLPQVNDLFNRLITKRKYIEPNDPKGQIQDLGGEDIANSSYVVPNIV